MKERLDDAMAEFQKGRRSTRSRPRRAQTSAACSRRRPVGGRDSIFSEAVEIEPDFVEAQQFLGRRSTTHGTKCRRRWHNWRAALRVQPDFLPALNEVAHVLAASPEASVRNGSEAVTLAERAGEIVRWAGGPISRHAGGCLRRGWTVRRCGRNRAAGSGDCQRGRTSPNFGKAWQRDWLCMKRGSLSGCSAAVDGYNGHEHEIRQAIPLAVRGGCHWFSGPF